MLQKKICLLGSFAVGKTSLIQRYVDSMFSDQYHTTVGVKIDKKLLSIESQSIMLMIWDLAGEDAFTQLKTTYLRGISGYIVVADGTRKSSFDIASGLHQTVKNEIGDVPAVFAINKSDLIEQWHTEQEEQLKTLGHPIFRTSAKTGENVENMFLTLGQNMVV